MIYFMCDIALKKNASEKNHSALCYRETHCVKTETHIDIFNITVFELQQNIYRCVTDFLTHWGRVTHICVGKLTIIDSDNGLSPGRRQAIIWTNTGILLNRTLGTNLSEILGKIHSCSFKKMHLKMSSAKGRLFSLGLNELMSMAAVFIPDETLVLEIEHTPMRYCARHLIYLACFWLNVQDMEVFMRYMYFFLWSEEARNRDIMVR